MHDNDYGFDVISILSSFEPKGYPSLSVLVPYYETGDVFLKSLRHLYHSINHLSVLIPGWVYEVIVIDDGSRDYPAEIVLDKGSFPNLRLIIFKENQGRTAARNAGLFNAKYDICLFMDADIMIDEQLIANHLKLHTFVSETEKASVITVAFFEFGDQNNVNFNLSTLSADDLHLNDYRLHCVYSPTWIGCEEDRRFVGEELRIVQDTHYFRSWKGMYKAWALPNMVLGGCFMVDREASLSVGGFNLSFVGYGFTETSLPTKLISIFDHKLIPMLLGGGLHIGDKKGDIGQSEKNRLFQEKHRFYFKRYLNLSFRQAIHDEIS